MEKSKDAFRTISEVAEWLDVPTHVLRFWESRFTQVKPVKRAGGRRYYRPADMALLGGIRKLLHEDGLTIRGAQKLLREQGVRHVASMSPPLEGGDVYDPDAGVVSPAENATPPSPDALAGGGTVVPFTAFDAPSRRTTAAAEPEEPAYAPAAAQAPAPADEPAAEDEAPATFSHERVQRETPPPGDLPPEEPAAINHAPGTTEATPPLPPQPAEEDAAAQYGLDFGDAAATGTGFHADVPATDPQDDQAAIETPAITRLRQSPADILAQHRAALQPVYDRLVALKSRPGAGERT
ncbi:MerR HTH family regulatory protein [Tranquillimonas rosea]|uniref:MerR HTH family regulatory protein n=1 Tax=Tranquillimonas rosea TaxID=641238 RepID=A0A1H9TIW0_9RHOB|nr:MerR family transcriptional regulator [Tranquillimonas rosea]SER97036.1 MerR HTH family regulatory protein [Tranquillimonas rosea]